MPDHATVSTDKAPAALGPYSQAVTLPLGDRTLIFVSGQIAMDPASGQLVEGPPEHQMKQVLDNVSAILEAAGSDFSKVVKTTLFLSDMDSVAACNEAYAAYFVDSPPARATVEVRRLPKDADVEIDVVAYGLSEPVSGGTR